MSQKNNLINFLKGKTATFTFDEIIQMIAIISKLEDPKPEEPPKKK